MPKRVSVPLREAMFGENSSEVAVVLFTIDHPDLEDGPLRFSSDSTERITTDPLAYGTRSGGQVFYFVLMTATLPDDEEGAPPSTSWVFDNVDRDMVKAARSIASPADVTMQLVLASTPDVIEESYTDLRTVGVSFNADTVTFEISREPFTSEPWPAHRMSKSRFPGLHR